MDNPLLSISLDMECLGDLKLSVRLTETETLLSAN